MNILVTGVAGFIGFHLSLALLERGDTIKGVCGRARSLVPAGGIPVPVRVVTHLVANIGQAEVPPNVKHDGRKTTGRKRTRHNLASKIIRKQGDGVPLLEASTD